MPVFADIANFMILPVCRPWSYASSGVCIPTIEPEIGTREAKRIPKTPRGSQRNKMCIYKLLINHQSGGYVIINLHAPPLPPIFPILH